MRKDENKGFFCEHCGERILPLTNGSYRNHCPYCLYSKHVDHKPGDRTCSCMGLMKPIDLVYSGKKGYQIVHQCKKCHAIQRNIIAQDTVQPDKLVEWFQRQM